MANIDDQIRKKVEELNKIIEELDYDNIPNQWKKELINDLK